MRALLFILSFLICNSTIAQIKKFIGSWVSPSQELVIVRNSIKGYLNNNYFGYLDNNFLSVSILGDTLSFWERGITGRSGKDEPYELKYDMKVIKITNAFMVLNPCSDLAIKYYNGKENIKFTRQELAIDSSIHFEGIVFQSTGCYGKCPSFHLKVDSAKNAFLNVVKVYKPRTGYKSIEASSGYFSGKLNDSTFNKLVSAIQSFGIEKVEVSPELCCDGAVVTLIIYYNKQRKYIKTMFPPRVMGFLVDTLYSICETSLLTKSGNAFNIEE